MISLLVFGYNWFRMGIDAVTIAVSLSLFSVVIFASIFGTIVPITLEKFKIDPANAHLYEYLRYPCCLKIKFKSPYLPLSNSGR